MKTFDITAGYEEYFTRYPILDAEGVASIGYAPAKMAPSERLFLWALAYGLRPATYLEIGSLEGGSALIVSAALDTLRCAGRMALIEPEPRILPEVWARIAPRATLHRALSPQAIPEAVAALGGPVELAFIDGDHSPEGARADAEGLLPHMAAGSYMLFHDAFFPDVKTAVDAFVRDHADRIVDCGTPTREVTHDPEDEEKRPIWGGLRMIHVTTG
ncbi:MAG: class I SAM-dependent methyltransferase [Thermoanaerobaculia bacterium]